MGASTLVPRVRTSRAAVFGVFGLNGFLCSMWVVHIPVITQRTGVSKGTLGLLILLVAIGGIVAMQAVGPLADRFGSRVLVAGAGVWISLAVLGPAFATGPLSLGVALLIYGTGNGALDVSMNAQAVQVERAYGRPIMSAFHAVFSCGGLAGSLIGAATMHGGWDVRVTMTAAGAIGLLTVALCIPRLLPRIESGSSATTPDGEAVVSPRAVSRRSASLRVLALAAIAFGFLLTEGVANDWSALQVREHLRVSDATAALAFGAFSVTMTVGRFTADRVNARFGRVAVVRWGALLAAAGLALIVSSAWLVPTLLGWALLGIGLAGGVPQIFTAAGNLGTDSAATDMSRVFGLGYLGFLAGPSVIGWLADLSSLTTALIFPLVLILACAAGAHIVGQDSGPADRS